MIVDSAVENNTKLDYLGIQTVPNIYVNLSPAELVEAAIRRNEGHLCDNGALAADTGKFTGRSPKDKFTVKDSITENTVWWGDINIPISPENFDNLYNKVIAHLNKKNEIFARDAYACASDAFRLNIRVVTEGAYQNLFC